MNTYWFNPSGSNTAPYDTKAKGATSFATLDTLYHDGDTCIVADGANTFTAQIHLFAGNSNLIDGTTFTLRSESLDRDLCSLEQIGAAGTRLLLLGIGSETTPDDLGCDVTVRGITLKNHVASGTTLGQLCSHADNVRNVTYEDCAFEFTIATGDVSGSRRQCIEFTQTDENRVATFTRCLFDNINIVNGLNNTCAVINIAQTTTLVLREPVIGALKASWLAATEYLGVFIGLTTGHAGIEIYNLRVVGPFKVTALGAATVLRGALCYNKYASAVEVRGADISGMIFDGEAVPAANVSGMAFYEQDNVLGTYRGIDFHDNGRIGGNTIIGGALCVKRVNSQSTAVLEDSRARNNEGMYGALAYTTTGGGVTVRRFVGSENYGGFDAEPAVNVEGLVVYCGGGAEPCVLEDGLCFGNDAIDALAVSIKLRNSDTPPVPGPRTETLRHITTFGDKTTNPEGGSVHVQQATAAGASTVSAVNCAFHNPDCAFDIGASASLSHIALSLDGCALRDADANIDGSQLGSGGSVTVTNPRALIGTFTEDGRPPDELIDAGVSTGGAVTKDLYSVPWHASSTPTIGALETLSPGGVNMSNENPQVMLDDSVSGDSVGDFFLFGHEQRLEISVATDDDEGGEVLLDGRPGTKVMLSRGANVVQLLKQNAFGNFVPFPTRSTPQESGIFAVTDGSPVTAKLWGEYTRPM